eukprot:scaffold3823_cov195-Amphora_coffeaeformis.AAC.20
MQNPFLMGGQALEAAGAGILQRLPVTDVGARLTDAAAQLDTLSKLIPQLVVVVVVVHDSPSTDGELAGQRLAFCAQQMTRAGQELQQGVVPTQPKGKSWLKGGM